MIFPVLQAKQFLIEFVRNRADPDLRDFAERIVDMHLHESFFPMPIRVNHASLKDGIRRSETTEELLRYVELEDTRKIGGICRVMARTHLNSGGAGFVSRRLPGRQIADLSHWELEKTLCPRVLGLFPSQITRETLLEYCDYQTLLTAWVKLANDRHASKHPANPFAFTDDDIDSLNGLMSQPLIGSQRSRPVTHGVHDNWAKLVWGIHSGLNYLSRNYQLDPTNIWSRIDEASQTPPGVKALTQSVHEEIVHFGMALSGSFFADLGGSQFVKPDVHVVESVAAYYGKLTVPDDFAVQQVQQAATANGITPRALDKIFYHSCKASMPLIDLTAPKGEANAQKRRFRLHMAFLGGGQQAAYALERKIDHKSELDRAHPAERNQPTTSRVAVKRTIRGRTSITVERRTPTKEYPNWGKQTPKTDPQAEVVSRRPVADVTAIHVAGATYRGSHPMNDAFEMLSEPRPLKNGAWEIEVCCGWHGVKPPSSFPKLTVASGAWTKEEGFRGDVADNIARLPVIP